MDRYEKEIIKFTKNLRNKLLEKYRRGRIEHGGEPTHVNAQAEINQEILDIINYHLIDSVNKESNRGVAV